MAQETTLFQEDPFLAACNVAILLQTLCIALPIAIYCSVTLYRNRNAYFMEKRGTILILYTCLVAVEGQLFGYPFTAFTNLLHIDTHSDLWYPLMLSRTLGVSFVTLRIYSMWADNQHSRLLLSEGWEALMDDNFCQTMCISECSWTWIQVKFRSCSKMRM